MPSRAPLPATRSVLLLDEPLSALDAHTRSRVREELGGHLRDAGLPTIVVTHDFTDAAALADRIGVLVQGKIVQTGTAAELIAAPTSSFVAEFAGSNLLSGTGRPGRDGLTEVTLEDGTRFFSSDLARAPSVWSSSPGRSRLPALSRTTRRRITSAGLSQHGSGWNRVRVTVGALTAEITAASRRASAL